jgi:hypothetical protein
MPPSLKKKMLTCEQVAHIIAQKPNIPVFNKAKLHMHLFICQSCLNYKKQIVIIDSSLKKMGTINLTNSQKEQVLKSRLEVISKYSND